MKDALVFAGVVAIMITVGFLFIWIMERWG